jgi:hypothetical protein
MKMYDFNVLRFSLNQAKRAQIFLDNRRDVDAAIPIIVTFHEYKYNFSSKIPIVPISRFKQFLQYFPFYLDKLDFVQRQ